METIITIPAQPEDLPEIKKLYRETITEICSDDYSPKQIKAWISKTGDWREKLENQYFLVAKTKGKILGFASLRGNDFLNFMYVHKDFQGMGVAKSLFVEIEGEAIRRNAKILKSEVSITAKSFFEKMGFKTIARQTNILKKIEIDNFKMEKILTGKASDQTRLAKPF